MRAEIVSAFAVPALLIGDEPEDTAARGLAFADHYRIDPVLLNDGGAADRLCAERDRERLLAAIGPERQGYECERTPWSPWREALVDPLREAVGSVVDHFRR